MEELYRGRATIQDNYTDFQIIIPAKRNWFIILFIGAWLGGWFMGESFALVTLTAGLLKGNPASLFLLFWLIAWTVGGFFAFRAFLWNLRGKEIITFGQGQLTINKKGALLFRPKVYDLNEVKNIRVRDDDSSSDGMFSRNRNDFGGLNQVGTIRFDYGLKTIKFAGGIDEAEAKFIVNKLKERHLITDKNFNTSQ